LNYLKIFNIIYSLRVFYKKITEERR